MRKRLLSLALALAVCLSLAAPALAADKGGTSTDNIEIDFPDGYSSSAADKTYKIREVSAGAITDKTTNTVLASIIARTGEPADIELPAVALPLGASITIKTPRTDWANKEGIVDVAAIRAYSDPDGDGVYDQWIFDFKNDPPLVPLTEEKVFIKADNVSQYSYQAYPAADGALTGVLDKLPASVTLTSDYLTEVFGANTLLLVDLQVWTVVESEPVTAFPSGTSGAAVYLLTGETAEAAGKPETPAEPDASAEPAEPEKPAKPAAPAFTDVPDDAYYAAPVTWAVENEITTGTSDTAFSPKQDCTNAQILTFLWRACGKPEPTIDNPFTNKISDTYLQAAVWAYEKGMVSGDTFDASELCTRAMAMTYIWQSAGSPAPGEAAAFTDVPADAAYAQAVAWAVEQDVTTGTSQTEFSPDGVCSRGQIVTFLHRALAE